MLSSGLNVFFILVLMWIKLFLTMVVSLFMLFSDSAYFSLYIFVHCLGLLGKYWGQFPNNWYQSSGLEEVSVREFLICSVVVALSDLPHQKRIISWLYWRRSRVRGFLVCFVVALCLTFHIRKKFLFLRRWYDVKVFKCNEVQCREIWWKDQFWLVASLSQGYMEII